jgi:hypothetical protein
MVEELNPCSPSDAEVGKRTLCFSKYSYDLAEVQLGIGVSRVRSSHSWVREERSPGLVGWLWPTGDSLRKG